MLHLFTFLLLLFVSSNSCNAAFHSLYARQKQSRSTLDPSLTSTSNTSSTKTSPQTHNSSFVISLASDSSSHKYNLYSSDITLPTPFVPHPLDDLGPYGRRNVKNYEDIKSGFCDLSDYFCSFKEANGTIREASPVDMSDQCVLWDTSCSGNKTRAMERFFSIAFADGDDNEYDIAITDNPCFAQWDFFSQSDCVRYNPPDRLMEWQKMKDWMRSPQCVLAAEEWLNMTGRPRSFIFGGGSVGYTPGPSGPALSCCSWCDVQAQNVDLYYWPEPDADLSCLSTIGGSVRPLDYGATTRINSSHTPAITQTYWGCTATDPESPGSTTTDWMTAVVSSIGSLKVKVPLDNPWSPSPCIEDKNGSQGLNRSIKNGDGHASIHARDHSLFIPSSITQTGSLPVSTVVSGDLTFTSPSIYAKFYGLGLSDRCGHSTTETLMLSFSVGELSSLEGNLGLFYQSLSTKQFDFRDLPCPPQSVMEANWYKPAPGEPYRPLVAMPSKIRHAEPRLNSCMGDFFTAYDPPHTLVIETALLPPSSAGDPRPAPVPSRTQDPSARATVAGKESTSLRPAIVPTADQPKATPNLPPNTNPKKLTPESHSNDPAATDTLPSGAKASPKNANQGSDSRHGSDPTKGSDSEDSSDPDQGSDSDQGSKSNGNPQETARPSVVEQSGTQQNNDAIVIPGINIVPEAPAVSVSGTLISLDSSSLVIGTNSIPFQTKSTEPFTTNFTNHPISAALDPVKPAETTLRPGEPGVKLDGTVVSLIEGGHSVVGSKTISLTTSGGRFGGPAALKIADPFVTTIDNKAITAALTAVTFGGTTMTRGAPGKTIGRTLVSSNPVGQLVVDSMTVTLAGTGGAGLGAFGDQSVSGSRITSIIGDEPITAAPVAVTFAGTTLTPGAPGKTMNGTLIGLNITGELVSGTKTVPFEIGGADLGKLIMGGFGAGGPLVSIPPSPITRGSSNGTRNTTTNADGAVFLGEAESLRKSGLLFWKMAAISVIAIVVSSRFNWWSSLC